MKSSMEQTVKSCLRNFAIKPLSIVLSLVYTPLLLGYLGTEKYGVWATILSVISWINYCDVGIGHGLRNLLSGYIAKEDHENAVKAVSTAYCCLTFIAACVFVILCALTACLNWNGIFNTEISVKMPLFISFVFICINFVLAISNTILYALQESELVSLRNVIIQCLNIAGIWLLARVSSGSLVGISILFGANTMIGYLFNSYSIIKKRNWLRPTLYQVDSGKIRTICNVGIKFFVIQIAYIFMYTVDNLLISHYFGSSAVTPYDMVYKIYNTGFGFYSALIVPIWSGATAAAARMDKEWFQKTLKLLNLVTGIFCLGYIFVALIFKDAVRIWLGVALDYPAGLIPLMCVYYIFFTAGTPYCQINNGIGAVNGQVWLGIIQGIVNIPMSIYLGVNCGMGVLGIKLATTILVVVGAVFHPVYYYYSIRKRNLR